MHPSHNKRHNMKKPSIITLLLATALTASAQSQWTLEQCISHALEHNISLQQRSNQNEQKALQVSTAKNARLPNLNAYAAQQFSFGRGLTELNTYTNNSTSSTSFGLSTAVPILTGMRLPNQLKLSKLNLEAASADLEKAKNDLSLRVAQYYITTIYNREQLAVAQRQVTIDSMQVARLEEMLRHGKVSPVEVSAQRATLENSRLTVTKAANELQLSRLDLSQLLELPSPEGFDVAAPTAVSAAVPANPETIYAEAVTVKPEITAEQLRLKGTEYSIKIAEAALYPTLDFNASLGTNYNTTSNYESESFGKQLKNKFSQGLGLQLNIPIFNRYSTRNNIRSAQLDRQNQMLAVDEAKKKLYKEILQVCYNAVAATHSYTSSQAAARSSEDAFQLMQAKYEAGKATMTEFNESKNNLLKAQSDLIRARYEMLYQQALVDFYRGKPLKM